MTKRLMFLQFSTEYLNFSVKDQLSPYSAFGKYSDLFTFFPNILLQLFAKIMSINFSLINLQSIPHHDKTEFS